MLRLVLGVLLFGLAGAIGFFYGRHLNSVDKAGVNRTPDQVYTPPPEKTTGERSRSVDSGATQPGVLPTEPSGIPLPQGSESTPTGMLPSGYSIGLPIAGLSTKDLYDTFDEARGGGERRHEATDIIAPRGTPVLAVADGTVKKLFTSVAGGLTVYQYDSAEQFCFYYAHLAGYAPGLREGLSLKRGDLIGYVGSTGNAAEDNPHLHFAILELGSEKKWWVDTRPINPYPALVQAIEASRRP